MFKGTPGNVTIIHADDTAEKLNGTTKPNVDFSNRDSYQIEFSVHPKLPVGIYTYEMDVVLTGGRGYNIILWDDWGGGLDVPP